MTDTYAENPLQSGYSYTYYCQASITEGETTETSTEVSSSAKFGLTIDMTDGGEVTENPDGTVTIKYTAPSTYGGETELPVPLTSLELYRLDKYDSKPATGAEPIQTVENPEPGAVVVFTDAEPVVNQENAWYVKALCSLGDGGKKVTGWVGYDVPRPVNNLTAVAEGNGMRLTWGAPTSGQNDYYGSNFDPEQTRYKIYRTAGYSQENWTLIAEDLTETEYLDDASDLEEPVQINYSVVAYNNVGEGSGACPDNTYASNSPYIIGPAYKLPFVENVPEDKKSSKLWSIDKPNGGCDWEFKKPFKVGSSWNPTATIEGVEGCGVMGVNYGSGYNRGEDMRPRRAHGDDDALRRQRQTHILQRLEKGQDHPRRRHQRDNIHRPRGWRLQEDARRLQRHRSAGDGNRRLRPHRLRRGSSRQPAACGCGASLRMRHTPHHDR